MPGDAVSESAQKILDAPVGALLEIQEEETTGQTEQQTEQLSDGTNEQMEQTTTDDELGGRTAGGRNDPQVTTTDENSTAPAPTSDSAPVSWFKRFFNYAFAESPGESIAAEAEQTEQLNNGTSTEQLNNGTTTEQMNNGTTTEETNDETDKTIEQSNNGTMEFLEVLYTLDGSEWHGLGKVGKNNWKNEFEIPITEWDDISKLQVSIQTLSVLDEMPAVYLDGMWVEAGYGDIKVDRDAYAEPGEADGLPRETVSADMIFGASKTNFRAGEDAVFEFEFATSTDAGIILNGDISAVPASSSTPSFASTTVPALSEAFGDSSSSSENIVGVPADGASDTPSEGDEEKDIPAASATGTDMIGTVTEFFENIVHTLSPTVPPEASSSTGNAVLATTTGETAFFFGNGFFAAKGKGEMLFSRFLHSIKNIAIANAQSVNEPKIVHLSVFDGKGNELSDVAKVERVNGKMTIRIANPGDSFRPGAYRLSVEVLKNGEVFIAEQMFTWGVLAVNTDKSIYLPGESAYIQMAALNDDGNTICLADLKLEIESPVHDISVFETGDGTITAVTPCVKNNVTDNPDYFAHYAVTEPGTYRMTLFNLENGYQITDTFEVRKDVSFTVERIGATRINPFKSFYRMTMNITAHQDFSGSITEFLPRDFEMVKNESSEALPDLFSVENVPDGKRLVWNMNIKNGESLSLSYVYQAPKISPQFYLLGPLRFEESENLLEKISGTFAENPPVFEEARQWQLASDATVVVILTSGTSWTIPVDWSASNTIHVIGGGGGGFNGGDSTAGGGGGGGAYASTSNITGLFYGTTSLYRIGAGKSSGGGVAGDTYFNRTSGGATTCTAGVMSVCAKGGSTATGTNGASGGSKASNVPANGGASGGTGGSSTGINYSGGGGGGAGGTNANGSTGGSSSDNYGGNGGGAADNGATGVPLAATSTNGVPGGVAWDGTIGGYAGISGRAGGNGSHGSGGGGGFLSGTAPTNGGGGGDGVTWTATVGGATAGPSGGGGGGGGDSGVSAVAGNGGAGFTAFGYGGGGGGGGSSIVTPGTGGTGGNGVIVVMYDSATPTFTSKDFQWYANKNAVQPDTTLAGLNATTTLTSVSSPIRLRMNVTVGSGAAATSSQAFTLQWAYGTTSGYTWTDVSATTSSSGTWKYYHNTSAIDGATTTALLLASSEKNETYQSGTTTRSLANAILINTEGEFDFALDPANATGTTYYFRMAKKQNGVVTALDGYSNLYPGVVINSSTLTERAYVFLNDNGNGIATTTDSYTRSHGLVEPSATSTSISGVKIGERLIARIQIDNTGTASSTAQYRLQYDTNSNGVWTDLSTTTAIRWSLSTKGALWGRPDGVPLPTRQVTSSCNGSVPYQEGRFVAGTATSTAFSIGPSKCTEIAYAFETSGATLNTTYRLRVIDGGTNTAFAGTYTYPTFTIETSRTITYSKEARGSFATSTLVSTNDVGSYLSIAIGIDGFPVMAHYDATAGDLLFVKCNDLSCISKTTATIDSATDAGYFTSIAIGTDGFPVIAFADGTLGGNFKVAKCNDASCSSKTVSYLDNTASSGFYSSVAIGSDGFPVISYQDNTLGDLKFAKCNNASCTSAATSTLDATGVTGEYTSIAIGTDGFPVIVYRTGDVIGDLLFIKCNDIFCTSKTPATIDSATDSGYYPSVAIGTDGFPVISFADATGGGNLKFAKCNDASCSSKTVSFLDNSPASGFFTSIAIGTDGFPVISYEDNTLGDLKFAKCNNTSCSSAATSTLDAFGDTGIFTALAIGADGFPVISHRIAGTTNDLLFLKCSNTSCSPATSSTANLIATSTSYATFLDDAGYNNVASDDSAYDSLSSASSSRLAYNFKKANTNNTQNITVTWNGQMSVATSSALQLFDHVNGTWTNMETKTAAATTANTDFSLTGTQSTSLSNYYQNINGDYVITARLSTGTTTNSTTLRTDQILITFATPSPTLTQRDYVFLNDNGNGIATTTDSYTRSHGLVEPSATSTSISGVKIGERLIARIQIDNTGTASSTAQYRLQYDTNSNGVWTDLSTTTAIRWSLSTKGALWGRPDGVPLPTRQVTSSCNGSVPYQEGRFVAGTATSTAFSIGPSKCTEIAYAFETSGATLNTTYRLRVIDGGTNTAFAGTYTYPTFTTETVRTITYSKEARGGYIASILASTGNGGWVSSLAMGVDGNPVISNFRYTDGFTQVTVCNDPSCASFVNRIMDSSPGSAANNFTVSHKTDIAIGVDGFPIFSYFANLNSNSVLKVAHCGDASCTVSLASTSTVDSLNGAGAYSSLAIGSDGFPVIAYYATTTADLLFAKCNNATCSSSNTSILDSTGIVGSNPSIVIGSDGFPVISYHDRTNQDLKIARCTDISCSSPVISVVDSTNDNGYYSAIALGPDGNLVIGYNGDGVDCSYLECHLRFARYVGTGGTGCSSSAWSCVAVDSTGNVGRYVSLAIGTDGFPVMSYKDVTNGYLKFAKCANLSCSSVVTSTVDSASSLSGFLGSVAIGSDGYPAISYFDNTIYTLRFAKCQNTSCSPTASSTANLPATSASYATFLDDAGYNNVASSDNAYDSLSSATSSRLAYNFKKASTTNTDQITVTWEGQVSVATTTSLQIYNTSGQWETIQTNTSPTENTDFTLSGSLSSSLSGYYDGSNIVTARVVTGTTTSATTLKTDQILITFSQAGTISLVVSTDTFGTLTPGSYKIATSTISVTTNNLTGYSVTMYGNNQGDAAASTTMYYASTPYSPGITDKTEWVPGGGESPDTSVAGNADTTLGQFLAFRVMSASGSAPFLSTAWWGATDAIGVAKWAGIASSTIERAIGKSSSAAPSGALNTVQYYLDVPTTQQAGNYTGDITFTAVMNI
jgi:hypothetical protein